MANLDSLLKKQRLHFANKGPYTQSYGFSSSHVWIWSWTMKTAEHWRSDAFELWCWKRLLRVPWTARRANQTILKEISPQCSLERLTLKLKLQYFGPPDAKSWLIGKDPDAGEDGRQKENGAVEDEMVRQHHWHDGHEFEQTLGERGQKSLACGSHEVAKSWTWPSDWTRIPLWRDPPSWLNITPTTSQRAHL